MNFTLEEVSELVSVLLRFMESAFASRKENG
jgi:hypothetical protein